MLYCMGVLMVGICVNIVVYYYGEFWLDELFFYLWVNCDYLVWVLLELVFGVEVNVLDGIYLLWVGFCVLVLLFELVEYLFLKVKVVLLFGILFGVVVGLGFVWLNFVIICVILDWVIEVIVVVLCDIID